MHGSLKRLHRIFVARITSMPTSELKMAFIAEYGAGDLVLLGQNLPHSWRSGPVNAPCDEMYLAVVVQVREEFLGAHFFKLREMDAVAPLFGRSTSWLAFGHTAIGRAVASSLTKLP